MWFGENMASTTQKGYNSFRFDSALGGVHTDAAQSENYYSPSAL